MGFIYKITNKINGKCYIGKTEQSIDKRFREHIQESTRNRCKDRPLYRAFRKYGVENFIIELIEVCDNTEEREIHWISIFQSYGNSGYNATKGGDGKPFIDYSRVDELISSGKTLKEISNTLGCSVSTISKYCKVNNIKTTVIQSVSCSRVLCIETGVEYNSVRDAVRAIKGDCKNISGYVTHIIDCCQGKRKTAIGFKWQFLEKHSVAMIRNVKQPKLRAK